MKGNYFNSDVIVPKVPAATQNAVYADGDILFDWTVFDIPRGGARLIGASIQIRHNKIATGVGGIDLVFANGKANNVAPTTIGGGNSVLGIDKFAETDIIGFMPGSNSDMTGGGTTATAVVHTTIKGDNHSIVLSNPNKSTGESEGYDRYYVAGLANAGVDLRSLVAFDADLAATSQNGTFTNLDGTAPNTVFAAGDVLHCQDGVIIGEVASVTTNNIVVKFDGSASTNHSGTFTVPADLAAQKALSADIVDDDLVYNIFPIRVILHFEN